MTNFPDTLAERYRQFKDGEFDPNISEFQMLAEVGQSPSTMVVACCDSRVQPEAIFSSGPGEMFVVRNVANLVPPFEPGGGFHGVSAALEFAVLNLGIRYLLVMGHSGCGGIKAALDQGAAEQTEARFITTWMSMLDDAKLSVLSANQTSKKEDVQTALEFSGVIQSLKNLRTFPFISELETAGKLSLHGAHFDVASGELRVLDEATKKFDCL